MRANPCLFGSRQLLQRKGACPHGAFGVVRLVHDSCKRIYDGEAIVICPRVHVFGVEACDTRFLARGQQHAIPMRQAETRAEIERELK